MYSNRTFELRRSGEIFIDTLKNQPCIHACMREGFEVKVVYGDELENNQYDWFEIYDFSLSEHKVQAIKNIDTQNITFIRILNKLDGVTPLEETYG